MVRNENLESSTTGDEVGRRRCRLSSSHTPKGVSPVLPLSFLSIIYLTTEIRIMGMGRKRRNS